MNKIKSPHVMVKKFALLSPTSWTLTPVKSPRVLAAMMAMTIALPLWLRLGLAQAAPPEPYLVKDINADTSGSYPGGLIYVNGTLFFCADDGINGAELWKSDGTEAGTVMVKDINPGSGGSGPCYLTEVNGTLFFWADDGSSGYELWKSDGTEAGTVLVKDIKPGSGWWGGSSPSYLTAVNGKIFFHADDGSSGVELWKSDGTAAGTVLVKDINQGIGSSGTGPLTGVDDTLFFSAGNGSSGYELWKSDGTEAGTVLVRDIYPGSVGSNPGFLTDVNGMLFFHADDGTTPLGAPGLAFTPFTCRW